MIRTRFAPSPTGNVHVGNIRAAIFNYLFAKSQNGEFVIRIEDTDLERSTNESIKKIFDSLKWLNIDYDGVPVYQTKEINKHKEIIKKLINENNATILDNKTVLFNINNKLYDSSFVTEPKDDVIVEFNGTTFIKNNYIVNINNDKETKINIDSLHNLNVDNVVYDANKTYDNVKSISFKRRYVYFNDLILGRLEKPLDCMQDFIIARSDGNPVFHMANVADDITQQITHVLRGNDHIDNTFKHLFLFKSLNAKIPQYGHFPMIINNSGKRYSKRDGDAYIGDFKENGILPQALFNFLTLCGWATKNNKEIISKQEMIDSFSLNDVNHSSAQFDMKKLLWMNQQYISNLSNKELINIIKQYVNIDDHTEDWTNVLVNTLRTRLNKTTDVIKNTFYLFNDINMYDEKAIKKFIKDNSILLLDKFNDVLLNINCWEVDVLEETVHNFSINNKINVIDIAQPLRIACTGNSFSPSIGETLFLLGKNKVIKRIENFKKFLDF